MTLYGVDWNGPFPDAEEVDQVYVTVTCKNKTIDNFKTWYPPLPIREMTVLVLIYFLRVLEFVYRKLN